MPDSQTSARRHQYLIDRPSQIATAWRVFGVLALIGVLYAGAVVVLSGPDAHGGDSLATSAALLLTVHASCMVLGGALLLWTLVRLTHRYAGPAHVMKDALAGMRKGEYGMRLSLRDGDFLVELADEIEALRCEIATRDVAHMRTVHRLERALEEHDDPAVIDALRVLGGSLPSMPPKLDRQPA